MAKNSWWQGKRGEWYVIVQVFLVTLLLVGPRTFGGAPQCCAPLAPSVTLPGALLMLAGAVLAATAALNLGKNLTPLPRPRENARLVDTGAYRLVRHPIYCGIIFMAFGWGLWLRNWPTLGYAFLLLVFFDIKSRREERWLLDKFPDYAAYRRRVRKLIPFVY